MQGGQAMAVFREERRDGLVAVGVTVDCVARDGKAAPRLTPWMALIGAEYENYLGALAPGALMVGATVWFATDWETIWNHHPALADAARVEGGPAYDWTSPAFAAVCERLGLSPLGPK